MILTLAASAHAQLTYDGVLFSRGHKADSYATHLLIGATQYLWFCGTSNLSPAGTNVDGIFRITKAGGLLPVSGWSPTPIEVLNQALIPWASHHVCDPSLVAGTFSYAGSNYQYALYFTADDNSLPVGVNNAMGVALSNDGLNWIVVPTPVIEPQNGYNGSYGAGAGGVARVTYSFPPVWVMVHQDTTVGPKLYFRSSTDGISWPSTPLDSHLTDAIPGATAPELAYNTRDCKWYVVVSKFTATEGQISVLKGTNPNDLDGPWVLIGTFTAATTGQVSNHNPGLARNADGTLYIDSGGSGYAFLSVGPAAAPGSPFPHWKKIDLAQGRFPAGTFGLCPRAPLPAEGP